MRDGGDAVAGQPSDDNIVCSSRGRGIRGRAVIQVVVAGIAGGGAQHCDQANKGHKQEATQNPIATHPKCQAAQTKRARQQKCPGDGIGAGAGRG